MKINPQDLLKLKNSGNYNRILNVIVFIGSKPLTSVQQNRLTKVGVTNIEIKNNIVHGKLSSKLLTALEEVDFVKYVEFSFDLDSRELSLLN